jgi:class 3 adenylate cyclase/tetratricopeptide (TPR) repeat protein
MQCPECQSDNPAGMKFCGECGSALQLICGQCNFANPSGFKFCGECGGKLGSLCEVADPAEENKGAPQQPSEKDDLNHAALTAGERKHVTVLFSDLTGYTAMSEKLDPEDVKEITSRVFGKIAKIVASYDGFIEKYAGDAVMAIFGVPQSHEDDPIRAIKAARKIHRVVDDISPEVEKKIGLPISMHTGINTGLVVTGEVNLVRGTHGVAGDTINLAARISRLAKPGEILVNLDTCRQVEGHFECEFHEEAIVKGKAEPVEVHKVLSERDSPVTIRRISGVRADLVGRSVEMVELSEAVDKLKQGKGHIYSISGAAGTGKSRLVEEFKATLDLEKIQWIECHAYAYSQEIPYFPLVDLLNRILAIDEKDPLATVREKVESGLAELVGNKKGIIPYVGGLYSLGYPQTEDVSPEFWKTRLQEAILAILSKLAEKAPTVFFIEDLHWADPSFVELLRRACVEIRTPALLLCAYRPTFSLFTGHQLSSIGDTYHEIKLENLSLTTAQLMLASLLKSESIPPDLKRWVNSKAEGNPFYLEELINSLIESQTLAKDSGDWKLTRSLTEADIPSSLNGLINGRLDRLEKQTKRILQEASVIGRDFLYEILKRITELDARIDGELQQLERLDLIRIRSLQPEIEYMFKHALTQEVVYNSLLKKERRGIHEKIAQVIETVFKDRLTEFNETIAYHFARGQSTAKAVDYLIKSGEKSLARYAVEEANEYFKKAYDLLRSKERLSEEKNIILIDLLNIWGYAFYYLGKFNQFIYILRIHMDSADSLKDKAKAGMFYAWFGIAHWMAGQTKVSFDHLRKGLELGEKTGNQKVVGYACTWLTWACGELGLFAEGIGYGERAQKIAESFPSDPYLFFKSLGGLCWIYFFKGDPRKIFDSAKLLLEYGERNENSRSKVMGNWMKAFAYWLAGDMKFVQKCSEKAIEVALDPFYGQFPKATLGFAHLSDGRLEEAEKVLQSTINFCNERGVGSLSVPCSLFLAPILIAKGQMQKGADLLEKTRKTMIINHRKVQYAISEYIFGEVYSQIATGQKPSLSIMAKNIGFLAKNVPFATKKAEKHFNKAIELFKGFGSKSQLALSTQQLALTDQPPANLFLNISRASMSSYPHLRQYCSRY